MARSRALLAAVALVGASTLLAGCEKPYPNVTVQSGSTSVIVVPQTYCFDSNPAHCHFPNGSGAITVKPGATILVDVPRAVAGKTWQVRSAQLVNGTSAKTIGGAPASSGVVSGTHSARVAVPSGVSTYLLVVTQSSAAWITHVTVKASA